MSQDDLNTNTDKIDLFFGNTLGNASANPSEHVWESIEKSLDEKKRKRFFWWMWSGIGFSVLIGAAILIPLLFSTDKKTLVANNKQIKTTEPNTNTNTTVIAEKENKLPTEGSNTNNKKETKAAEKTLIQLGAFKNEVESKVFSNISYPIVVQKGTDGYTRYFAEINTQPAEAIQTLKDKGFTTAYINKHIDKNIPFESLTEVSPTVAQQTKTSHNTNQSTQASSFVSVNNATAKTKQANISFVSNTATQPVATTTNSNAANTNVSSQSTPATSTETAQTNSLAANENKQAEEKTPDNTASTTSDNIPVKDSSLVAATTEEKKDSAEAKKQEKPTTPPDSSLVKKDSLKNESYPKWAISLEGGPLLFVKNVQSNLFTTSGEKEMLTYNGGLKVERRLNKYLSLIAGVNYSTFIAKQDATYFYFPKNITTDYTFYTSYGTMSASSSTLLSGFSPAPWITTLQAQYSYRTQLSFLSIPIQANLTYLRTKRITLFVNAGINTQFAIAQQNHLDIIKEHETDHVDNNNITVNKFTFSLVAGLGCDIRLFKGFYFTASPGFVYGFTNLSNTAGIKNTPQYFMGNAGLKIKW